MATAAGNPPEKSECNPHKSSLFRRKKGRKARKEKRKKVKESKKGRERKEGKKRNATRVAKKDLLQLQRRPF